MKILLFFFCLPILACSQAQENNWVNQHQKDYKNVLKDFYALLYNQTTTNLMLSDVYWDASLDTGMLKKVKPYLEELTNGFSKDEIFRIIDNAELCNEGLQFAVYLKLSFPKKYRIYFELGSDMPSKIDKIWLSDGTLLSSKVRNESPVQKLLLVGVINDKDGFTNVREGPSTESKVIDKITANEYFFYIPSSTSDWWQVSRKDDVKAIIGFVHNSRILKYSSIKNEMKRKIEKDRNDD